MEQAARRSGVAAKGQPARAGLAGAHLSEGTVGRSGPALRLGCGAGSRPAPLCRPAAPTGPGGGGGRRAAVARSRGVADHGRRAGHFPGRGRDTDIVNRAVGPAAAEGLGRHPRVGRGQGSNERVLAACTASAVGMFVEPRGQRPIGGLTPLLAMRLERPNPARRGLYLHQLDALPLKVMDQIQVELELRRPMFVYVVWINSAGKALPVYPWRQFEWDQRPAEEQSVEGLKKLPEGAVEDGWEMDEGAPGHGDAAAAGCDSKLSAAGERRRRRRWRRSARSRCKTARRMLRCGSRTVRSSPRRRGVRQSRSMSSALTTRCCGRKGCCATSWGGTSTTRGRSVSRFGASEFCGGFRCGHHREAEVAERGGRGTRAVRPAGYCCWHGRGCRRGTDAWETQGTGATGQRGRPAGLRARIGRGNTGRPPNWPKNVTIRQRLYPKKEYPDGHPELAESLYCLGSFLQAQGEYAKAEPFFRDALAMCQKLYPKDASPTDTPTWPTASTTWPPCCRRKGSTPRPSPSSAMPWRWPEALPQGTLPRRTPRPGQQPQQPGLLARAARGVRQGRALLPRRPGDEPEALPQGAFPTDTPNWPEASTTWASLLQRRGSTPRPSPSAATPWR